MRIASIAAVIGGLHAALGGLPAQPPSPDPARFTRGESSLHAQLGRLDPAAATATILGDPSLRQDGDARTAALAEHLALELYRQAADFLAPGPVARALADWRTSPLARRHPHLRDVLDLLRVRILHRMGDEAGRNHLREELGMLRQWWVLGPFENERGAGYDAALPPETTLDLAKTYRGKKRDVRWRRLPAAPAIGYVDLGALMRPTQQVLGYACTVLRSDADRTVALHLGSSQAFKVFLNGAEIAGRSLRREFQYDQDTVRLPLRAGPNLLVLKICAQDGGFGFAARLRQGDGRPLTGVTDLAEPDDLQAAAATRPREGTAEPFFVWGARAAFAPADPAAAPADAYRRSAVLDHYRAADATDPARERLLEAAAAAMPDAPLVGHRLADARPQQRTRAERDDNARRHDLEAVLRRHPDHVATLVRLAALDLQNTGAAARARALLQRALKNSPDNPWALGLEAAALRALDLDTLGAAALARAAAADAAGNFRSASRQQLGRAHLGRGELAAAERCFEAVLGRHRSVAAATILATIRLRRGQRDAAVKLLLETTRLHPYSAIAHRSLANLFASEGDVTRAMTHVRQMLELCPEDADAWVLLAELCGLADQTDRQREALRTAVGLEPNRKTERRQLEFLEAETKPFYAPYVLDATAILAADPGPPQAVTAANDPFHYLLDQRVVHAYGNGTTSEYRHVLVRILNEEGQRQFQTFRVSYYWGEQRARVLEAALHRGAETIRPRLRSNHVPFPPLQNGDVLSVRYRIDDTAPGFFGDYFGLEHTFQGQIQRQRATLTVVMDPGREYQLQTRNGAPQPTRGTDDAGRAVWTFDMRDLARTTPEELQPAAKEFAPLVRVTTYEDWNAFASWWSNLIRDQQTVSPAMRAKALELTAGKATNTAKIAAIYDFVTTEIRYEAWEFGVHGYKPYSTPVIFERRHGDCKDKSLLLNAMLSVVDIEAHPVLIHGADPRSRDDLTLAMVHHFNHCISYVPATDSSAAMFLDGTATFHPIDTLPRMDYGADVLVVHGAGGTIRTIPWPAATSNAEHRTIDVELQPNGDGRVRFRNRPTRNRAVQYREYFGSEQAKQREKAERMLKPEFGKIEVTDASIALTPDVDIQVTLDVTQIATRQGEGLVLRSSIGVDDLSQLAIPETRRHALLLGVPVSGVIRTTYRLPAGFRPLSLPADSVRQTAFAAFSLTWHRDGQTVTAERRLALQTNRIEPANYPAFRAFALEVDRASREVVVVEKRRP